MDDTSELVSKLALTIGFANIIYACAGLVCAQAFNIDLPKWPLISLVAVPILAIILVWAA